MANEKVVKVKQLNPEMALFEPNHKADHKASVLDAIKGYLVGKNSNNQTKQAKRMGSRRVGEGTLFL